MEPPGEVPSTAYARLGAWLAVQSAPRATVPSAEVEAIIGRRLPPSARTTTTWWWSSERRGPLPARAWLAAGWRLEAVDRQAAVVTYVRVAERPP